jgi:hypothetical protein
MGVALAHYRQAVDNFTDGNNEACNGQLRSFFEDLIKGAAQRKGHQQTAGVQVCLDYLRSVGTLDSEEWAIMRAHWNGCQDNGPHAGLSDVDEARFRMYTLTSVGRYLLKKATL